MIKMRYCLKAVPKMLLKANQVNDGSLRFIKSAKQMMRNSV